MALQYMRTVIKVQRSAVWCGTVQCSAVVCAKTLFSL